MTTVSTIRRYTPEDADRVGKAALRFCKARGLTIPVDVTALDVIGWYCDTASREHRDTAPRRQWGRAMCRALRIPYDARVTIAYGYIGVRID